MRSNEQHAAFEAMIATQQAGTGKRMDGSRDTVHLASFAAKRRTELTVRDGLAGRVEADRVGGCKSHDKAGHRLSNGALGQQWNTGRQTRKHERPISAVAHGCKSNESLRS